MNEDIKTLRFPYLVCNETKIFHVLLAHKQRQDIKFHITFCTPVDVDEKTKICAKAATKYQHLIAL